MYGVSDYVGDYIMRRFLWYGAEKYGLTGKLYRLERVLMQSNKRARCVPSDVLTHYIDAVIIRLLDNMDRRLRIVSGRDVLVDTYDIDDPVVQQNYQLLPVIFGYSYWVCPVSTGTCASSPSYPCVGAYYINGQAMCCTGGAFQATRGGGHLVDNPPWVSNYSTGSFSLNFMMPTTPGIVEFSGSATAPSCIPTSGVTLYGPVLVATIGGTGSGYTCASSCPSSTVCPTYWYVSVPYCPGNTYDSEDFPILYFNASLTVVPNGTYAVWVQFQFT